MIKRNWKVWVENEEQSRKQNYIVGQKILFEGEEKKAKKYYEKESLTNSNLHIGYELTE